MNDQDGFICAHWQSESEDAIHVQLKANGYDNTIHYVIYRINILVQRLFQLTKKVLWSDQK